LVGAEECPPYLLQQGARDRVAMQGCVPFARSAVQFANAHRFVMSAAIRRLNRKSSQGLYKPAKTGCSPHECPQFLSRSLASFPQPPPPNDPAEESEGESRVCTHLWKTLRSQLPLLLNRHPLGCLWQSWGNHLFLDLINSTAMESGEWNSASDCIVPAKRPTEASVQYKLSTTISTR
jgi:hypothetical protein